MIPNQNQYPGPAWNAYGQNYYEDGLNGATRTVQAGDSPNGQLNLGQGQLISPGLRLANQMPQPIGGGARGSLVQFLSQIAAQMHQGQGAAQGPQGPPTFNPNVPGAGYPGLGQHPVVDRFHAVSAANQLAQMLASQHTATLSRYRGRN